MRWPRQNVRIGESPRMYDECPERRMRRHSRVRPSHTHIVRSAALEYTCLFAEFTSIPALRKVVPLIRADSTLPRAEQSHCASVVDSDD